MYPILSTGLMTAAVPGGIRSASDLRLPPAVDEETAVAELRALAGRNLALEPMIGLGYAGTVTPAVVRRNVPCDAVDEADSDECDAEDGGDLHCEHGVSGGDAVACAADAR